jgi:hypothetical protein
MIYLQLGTILNNEGCVLESFFQFFGMADQCFFFLQIFATWWICFQKMNLKKKKSMIFRCVPHFAKVFNFKFGLILEVCAKFQTIEIVLAN